jgi:hypothetical protein
MAGGEAVLTDMHEAVNSSYSEEFPQVISLYLSLLTRFDRVESESLCIAAWLQVV